MSAPRVPCSEIRYAKEFVGIVRLSLSTLVVLGLLVVVAAIGSAYLVFWAFTQGTSATAAPPDTPSFVEAVQPPSFEANLGQFTVNLAGSPLARNYLRTTIVIDVTTRRAESEVEARMTQMRDAVIATLRRVSPGDLATDDGLVNLKAQVRQALNPLLQHGDVTQVYFLELVVQ